MLMRSPSAVRRIFAHVSAAFCCGNRRPRIGRLLHRPPSRSPASASARAGRGFSGG